MFPAPFSECVRVARGRQRRRTVHVPKDRVEHGPRRLGESRYQLAEFAVEVAQKQQGLFTQQREARVVNCSERILDFEKIGHHADRKSTRLNSSHEWISYAVFCLKKKKKTQAARSCTKKQKKIQKTT